MGIGRGGGCWGICGGRVRGPTSDIYVRFLLGYIALSQSDHQTAKKEYLKGEPNSPDCHPNASYLAALIAFREDDYVAACTYLRRGIAANPYIA